MTYSSDRLDRIEALAERNREDINVLLEGQTRLQNVQVELGQTQAQLGRTQELLAETQSRNDRTQQLLVEVLADVRANLTELRAGQERQERILDFLMRGKDA